MSIGLERRHYARKDYSTPVRIQQTGSSESSDTLTKNIGQHGIRVLTKRFFPNNAILKIDLPHFIHGNPISVLGRVVWTRKMPHSDNYHLGVEFHDTEQDFLELMHSIPEESADYPAINPVPYTLSV